MVDVATKAPVYEGAANFQKNVETVGGKLLLYQDALVFEPHILNVQKKSVLIALPSVSKIKLGWTKLLGFIPILPNAIIVYTDENKLYRFTVFHRKEWLRKIEPLRKK